MESTKFVQKKSFEIYVEYLGVTYLEGSYKSLKAARAFMLHRARRYEKDSRCTGVFIVRRTSSVVDTVEFSR